MARQGKAETVFIALNQKIVTISKYDPQKRPTSAAPFEGKTEPYTIMAQASINNAARRMNGKRAAGFELWALLQGNANGYRFTLSNKDFSERYGINKHAYDSGVRILIDEGFLKQHSSHEWIFYEYPPEHRKGKSAGTAQTKVRKADKQKYGNSTLKSAETAQANIITDNIKDNINDNIPPFIESNKTHIEGDERETPPPPPIDQSEDYIKGLIKTAEGLGFKSGTADEAAFFADVLSKTHGDSNTIIEACTQPWIRQAADPGGELLRYLRIS